MESSQKLWDTFMSNCLSKRLRSARFEALYEELSESHPLESGALARITLQHQDKSSTFVDPLYVQYLEHLLRTELVHGADMLEAVLQWSAAKNLARHHDKRQHHVPSGALGSELEEVVLGRIMNTLIIGKGLRNIADMRKFIYPLQEWMSMVLTADTSDSMMQAVTGTNSQADTYSLHLRESLGVLVGLLLENPKFQAVLEKGCSKGKSFDSRAEVLLSLPQFTDPLSMINRRGWSTRAERSRFTAIVCTVVHAVHIFPLSRIDRVSEPIARTSEADPNARSYCDVGIWKCASRSAAGPGVISAFDRGLAGGEWPRWYLYLSELFGE